MGMRRKWEGPCAGRACECWRMWNTCLNEVLMKRSCETMQRLSLSDAEGHEGEETMLNPWWEDWRRERVSLRLWG